MEYRSSTGQGAEISLNFLPLFPAGPVEQNENRGEARPLEMGSPRLCPSLPNRQ